MMAARHTAQAQVGTLEGALSALESRNVPDADLIAARKALREAIASLRKARVETTVAGHADEARAKADRMREVSDQQRELGRRQAELGERQSALGRQQAELGRRQRIAAEAARARILAILEEARAKGQIETVK
jgi:hypothetical protein